MCKLSDRLYIIIQREESESLIFAYDDAAAALDCEPSAVNDYYY